MIVDFHSHAFPDALAERSVSFLAAQANLPVFSDGTTAGLIRSAKTIGADGAVVLPVVTKPSQFRSINAFAKKIDSGEFDRDGVKLRSFGGVHPDSESVKEDVKAIKALGLKGIKLHPDYQGVFVDDDKVLRVIDAAMEEGLFVSIHAGLDLGFPGQEIRCTPKRAKRMLSLTGATNVILAHMGGFMLWEEVADLLVGENVIFDTGVVAKYMDVSLARKIVRAHGADKILFATDSPWASYEDSFAFVRAMGLSKEEEDLIFGLNAAKILEEK